MELILLFVVAGLVVLTTCAASAAWWTAKRTRALLELGESTATRGAAVFFGGTLRSDIQQLEQRLDHLVRSHQRIKEFLELEQREVIASLAEARRVLESNHALIGDVVQSSRETDLKLRDYRSGYRWSAVSQVFGSVIHCLDFLDDQQRVATDSADRPHQLIHTSQQLLADAIRQAGIEEIGEHELMGKIIDEVSSDCRVISTLPTDDATRNRSIAKVHRRGYYSRPTPETRAIVRYAEVVTWKYSQQPAVEVTLGSDNQQVDSIKGNLV